MIDRAITDLADSQHSVIARCQLLAQGIGDDAIQYRLSTGRLHSIHPGVYTVGHNRLTSNARLMAAVLAAGPGSVISYRSAADLWGIRRTASPRIEVTCPRKLRDRPGILIRCSSLSADESTTHNGIRVTTVPRTLLDLADVVNHQQLTNAINEADKRHLWDGLSLPALLARYPGRPGTPALRQALAESRTDPGVTRSALEDLFLTLIAGSGLPRPKANHLVQTAGRLYECDCVWPDARIIVELDSRMHHDKDTEAFETDREKDRALLTAGWRVIRVTWRQVTQASEALVADLAGLLGS